ncbi:hypothetical protein O1R50_08915 [Glycomyces luteolus]|uniref:Uncharacterized protein n=1 Tax=Glycomyces luteolus TaxID=2670330 RepID=A0A9X3SQ56_9ACTN|nr:hypothetical protein [Glycomyces luteolus]MDA1359741.1 hypothetical protein [Glycomyces luteolus]
MMDTWQRSLQPAGPTAHANTERSAPSHDQFPQSLDGITPARERRRPDLLAAAEIGRILSGGEWLSVHYHNARAMWLCRNSDFRSTVGIIRWDFGKSPQLLLDPNDARFDHPDSSEVLAMVGQAMAVWWCVVDQQVLDPRLKVAIHPVFAPFVVYRGSGDHPHMDVPRQRTGFPSPPGTQQVQAHRE